MTIILYRDNVPVVDLTDIGHAAAVAHWQYVRRMHPSLHWRLVMAD